MFGSRRCALHAPYILLVGCLSGPASLANDLASQFDKQILPLFERYCYPCHDAKSMKGDLDLSRHRSLADIQANFRPWETILQQIEDAEMPPKAPLPTEDERKQMEQWIRSAFATIDWSKHDGVTHAIMPRLSKREYNNTLRDLLGIDFQPAELLLDDSQGLSGFTNDREALFISPTLAEQLFDAAEYALNALLALDQPLFAKTFEAESMLMTERGSRPQTLPKAGMGYSLAGAGQRTLYDEVTVPHDGWYRFTVLGVGIEGDSGMRLRVDNKVVRDVFCRDEQPEETYFEVLLRAGPHQMTWNIELPTSLRRTQERNQAANIENRATGKRG
jgi:hypothetical protein